MWTKFQRRVYKMLRVLEKGSFDLGNTFPVVGAPVNKWQQLPDRDVQLSVYKSFLVLVASYIYKMRNKEHPCLDPGPLH